MSASETEKNFGGGVYYADIILRDRIQEVQPASRTVAPDDVIGVL